MSLDERKCKILGAVVREYVNTIRPVGSEELASRHSWGVKSATIRNEMAELSELGYLRQPHTSAGRIPSDRGYRFYVDHLMMIQEISAESNRSADDESGSLELDSLLRQTCALLTRTTSCTSVATPPRPADTKVDQVFLSPMGGGRLLLVVVLSTGQVENRLMPDIPEITPPELTSLRNALNVLVGDKMLDAIVGMDSAAIEPPNGFSADLRSAYQVLAHAICHTVESTADADNVYLEGTNEILRQPEFHDIAKIEGILETLQKRTLLFQTLSRALLGPDVTVVIGSEHDVSTMRECSVITASYYVGIRERGTIGVVGPTRMDYDRAVPAVSFFARALTQTLSRFSSG